MWEELGGTLIGCLVIGILNNGMNLMGIRFFMAICGKGNCGVVGSVY